MTERPADKVTQERVELGDGRVVFVTHEVWEVPPVGVEPDWIDELLAEAAKKNEKS